MQTLNVQQAAALIKLHPVTLRGMARAGQVPAAKIGKCYVFIDTDLLDWLRSQYTHNRQDVGKEDKQCYSKEEKPGITNLRLVEKQYTDLLGPKTKKKHKS